MATAAKFAALLFFLGIVLDAATASSVSKGSRLIRSEPLAVRILPDGQAAQQREDPQQHQTSDLDKKEDKDEEEGVAFPPITSASMAAIQMHAGPVQISQNTSYLELATQWAWSASESTMRRTSRSLTAARRWFSSAANSFRVLEVARLLPNYLSFDTISIWQVNARSDDNPELQRCFPDQGRGSNGQKRAPRLAFTLPQPLAAYQWFTTGKSSTKLNIYLCPSFFNKDVYAQAAVLIHEVLHHLGCNDLAYAPEDILRLSPQRSMFNTNSWVSYVLEVAFDYPVKISASSPVSTMDCSKLPGTLLSNDVDNGVCVVIANTRGSDCSKYCGDNRLLCDNSWDVADTTEFRQLPVSYTLMSNVTGGVNASATTAASATATYCTVRRDNQVCACTEEDLDGSMDVQTTTTTTTSSSTTTRAATAPAPPPRKKLL